MKNLQIRLFILYSVLIAGLTYAQTTEPPASAKIVFTAIINAEQENSPSDTSRATGTAWAILSGDSSQLTYRVTYAGLTSGFTAAHFHLGLPGVSGPVIQPIEFNGNTADGTWTGLTDSTLASLLKGEIYINIHSSNFPAGEIRGQLLASKGIPFIFSPDSSQSNGSSSSSASGTGWAVLNVEDSIASLSYGVTVAGLSSNYTASHFHLGAAGENGGVVHPVTLTDSSAYNTWDSLSGEHLLALLRNRLYFNVHTANNPNGEIRGQLMESAPVSYIASLEGSQEVPAVTTDASGTGTFVFDSTFTSLSYSITYASLQDTFSAAHFHLGAPGVAGGVVQPITFDGNTAIETWTDIPDSLVINLVRGNLYVNIHSTAHPAGEIRGQVLLNEGIPFSAVLNAAQEVPPAVSGGSGTAWLSLINDTLKYRITIAGLSSAYTASHFHLGDVGVAGDVVQPITFPDSTADSSWSSMDVTSLAALVKNGLYINVHTADNPGGEIRGQIFPSIFEGQPPTGVDDQTSSVPARYELGQNYPNPFNPTTTINYSIPSSSFITIKVFDMLGREVATLVNEQKTAGRYQVLFSGNNLPSGVYFYRMDAGNVTETKKFMLLK